MAAREQERERSQESDSDGSARAFLTVTRDPLLAERFREAITPLGGMHIATDSLISGMRRSENESFDLVLTDIAGLELPLTSLAWKLRLNFPAAELFFVRGAPGEGERPTDTHQGTLSSDLGGVVQFERDLSAERMHSRLEDTLAQRERIRRCGWVGLAQPMGAAADLVLTAASTDATVLLEGESGTGKELAARAVHNNSSRRMEPFVAVNCAAFTESLLESELFGHEKGAFTDAFARKTGVFEAANGGTIFLDEIGEMAAPVQSRLLRVLEEHRIRRVGAATSIPVDFRVVAATNRSLVDEIDAGRFRRDLYYRIAVIKLRLAPLRERPGDLPALLSHFLRLKSEEDIARLANRLDEVALRRLVEYDWAGNIRELANFAERLLLAVKSHGRISADRLHGLLESGRPAQPYLPVPTTHTAETVERELVFRALGELKRDIQSLREDIRVGVPGAGVPNGGTTSPPLPQNLEELEAMAIERALEKTGGNRRRAAKLLGIGERTLYRKIKTLGLG